MSSPRVKTVVHWAALAQLIRLSNQSGTWLLLLPTWWALVLASHGHPSFRLLLIFAAGSFVMRSAGVVLNDLADRDLDRQVRRTSERPLASGRLTSREAMGAAVVLLGIAGLLLVLLPPLARALGLVAFLLAAMYPYSKRVFVAPQLILGLAFGWGVLMAWAAVRNTLDTEAWLLYAATVCWAIAYDTVYALQDRDDDVRIGVRSTAVLFGSHTWLAVAVVLAMMVALLAELGQRVRAGTFFYLTLIGVAGVFAVQVRELRAGISARRAFALFKQHIWAGVAVLIGLWLGLH